MLGNEPTSPQPLSHLPRPSPWPSLKRPFQPFGTQDNTVLACSLGTVGRGRNGCAEWLKEMTFVLTLKDKLESEESHFGR